MRISIALASYNGARYIEEQLQSFVSQTRRPDELVVSDDNSTDNTIDIVTAFGATAPFPVRIFKNLENLGFCRNFERALSLCDGDLIFLSDQDDVWLPHKIATVESVFLHNKAVQVVLNDQTIVDANLVPSGRSKLGQVNRLGISQDTMVTGCCTTIRREFRDFCVPFPPVVTAHDIWIGRSAVALGVREVLGEQLQLYRRHGQNVSNWAMSGGDKVSRWAFFKKARRNDAVKSWSKQIGMLSEVLIRIDRRDVVQFSVSSDQKQEVRRRVFMLNSRIDIARANIISRIYKIAKLTLQGGYRNWQSAVLDMIR